MEGDYTPGALNTYTEVEGVFLVEAFLAIRLIHTWIFQHQENKLMLIKKNLLRVFHRSYLGLFQRFQLMGKTLP